MSHIFNRINVKLWGGVSSYTAWYLLPTIRFGLWDHRGYLSKNHGGFLAFTWVKFDTGLMWTVSSPNSDIEGKQ